MIRKDDLMEAIAECQGEKTPNANTCIKLAAYYTILNNMDAPGDNVGSRNSFAPEPAGQVRYNSGSEFSEAVYSLNKEEITKIMDELMDALQVLMPKLYYSTLDKIKEKY